MCCTLSSVDQQACCLGFTSVDLSRKLIARVNKHFVGTANCQHNQLSAQPTASITNCGHRNVDTANYQHTQLSAQPTVGTETVDIANCLHRNCQHSQRSAQPTVCTANSRHKCRHRQLSIQTSVGTAKCQHSQVSARTIKQPKGSKKEFFNCQDKQVISQCFILYLFTAR